MPELTQAFMTHREKTQGQIERLEADPSVIPVQRKGEDECQRFRPGLYARK